VTGVLHAVVKLTQSLATEWADRGLQVNCVSPGIVNTALIQVIETSEASSWIGLMEYGAGCLITAAG